MTDGAFVLRSDDGERVVELTAGRSYKRSAGIEHNAVNESDKVVVLLEISLKTGSQAE